MTNLEIQTHTHPPIPLGDLTPLEKLMLSHVLECSETDAGLVMFTDVGPINPISVKRQALLNAFRASASVADSALNAFIANRILALLPTSPDGEGLDIDVEVDLSEFPWQFILCRYQHKMNYLEQHIMPSGSIKPLNRCLKFCFHSA